MDDPVPIPLKWRAVFGLWLADAAPAAFLVLRGVKGHRHSVSYPLAETPLIEAAGTSIILRGYHIG